MLASAVIVASSGFAPDAFAPFGNASEWFAAEPASSGVADEIMPEYLESQLAQQGELDAIQEGAYCLLDEEDPKANPYNRTHRKGCGHDIWIDRDAEELREAVNIDARDEDGKARPPENRCGGCLSERRLYLRVKKNAGSATWLDVARRLFRSSRLLEQYPALFESTSARDWQGIEVVRSEINKREAYLNWRAGQST